MKLTRLALLAPLLLSTLVVPAGATGAPKSLTISRDEFKDLPGVTSTPQPDRNAYQCSTVLRQTDRIGEIDFFGDSGMPRVGYRCERNGLVYEGTRPPLTGQWAPGINPHHLPD